MLVGSVNAKITETDFMNQIAIYDRVSASGKFKTPFIG